MKKIVFSLPIGLALITAYLESLWMALATILLIFIIVSVVPICNKRESLFIFVIFAFVSMPINYFILNKYDFWLNFTLACDGSRGMIYHLYLLEYILILSSIEEIVITVVGSIVWREQHPIILSVEEENDEPQ